MGSVTGLGLAWEMEKETDLVMDLVKEMVSGLGMVKELVMALVLALEKEMVWVLGSGSVKGSDFLRHRHHRHLRLHRLVVGVRSY